MDLDAFRKSPVGRLEKISVVEHDTKVPYFAYVPNPLPSEFPLSPATWAKVADAAHNLGQLDTLAGERLPDPWLISRPTIRREAVSTSALEGTFAPAVEVLTSEVDEQAPPNEAVREVLNFIAATDHALASDLPICVRLCSELQAILVRGTRSEDYQSGRVRETQVIIGPYKGCSILESHYVPPPPGHDLETGLSDWEKWIHAESELHHIVRIAMAHYQFEALHPYTDGNGRIGRLVAILQLIDSGLLPEPLINLSPYFEARSDEYRHRLRSVSTGGAIDQWVRFFCDALVHQASEAQDRIRRLLQWRDSTISALRANKHKGTSIRIVENLIRFPTFSVKMMAEHLEASVPATNTATNKLTEIGVLREVTGGSYNRIFQAPDVVRIIFS